jgi:hypothetical protein
MPAFNFVDSFAGYISEGRINLRTDRLKVVLTNVEPDAENDQYYSDLVEITAGNGYPLGGLTVNTVFTGRTGSAYKLTLQDKTLTASGGSIGPFRYAVLVDTTPTAPPKPIVGWWDYVDSVEGAGGIAWGQEPITWGGIPITWGSGAATGITLPNGSTLTFDFSAQRGALQVRQAGVDPDAPTSDPDSILWGGESTTWGGEPLTWG